MIDALIRFLGIAALSLIATLALVIVTGAILISVRVWCDVRKARRRRKGYD